MVVTVLGFTTAVLGDEGDGTCDAADPQICYIDGKMMVCSSVCITFLERARSEYANRQAGILPDWRKLQRSSASNSTATNHGPICSADSVSRKRFAFRASW